MDNELYEIGNIYGAYYFVQRLKPNGTSPMIRIKCIKCGGEKSVRLYDFKRSRQKCLICGCESPDRNDIDKFTIPKIDGVVAPQRRMTRYYDPDYEYCNRKTLKAAYLRYNTKKSCSVCGLETWLGKSITLDIDHIIAIANGGKHKLSNCQYICPNCHRQKTSDELA